MRNPEIKYAIKRTEHEQWTVYLLRHDARSTEILTPLLRDYVDGSINLDTIPYLRTSSKSRNDVLVTSVRVPEQLHAAVMRKTAQDEIKAGQLIRSLVLLLTA